MEKQLISKGEYNSYLEKTRWADDNRTELDDIIDIFEYLKDKNVKDYSFDSKPKIIENAHLDFIIVALGRSHFSPYYNHATENFLKSDYLSGELKKEIINMLGSNCSKELFDLLNSEKEITDFSKEEIKVIEDSLRELYKKTKGKKKEKCGDMRDIFAEYIFVLDGIGPIEYMKEKYKEKLPIVMLENSGLPSFASYYSGYGVDSRYLGEKHLLSIYKKFDKFYPDKKQEFVKMVNRIRRLTPTEFINNYLEFSRNGLDSEFKNKNGNISVDESYGSIRDMVGALSITSLVANNNDKEYELDSHYLIRKEFSKMIKEYEERQKPNDLQTKVLHKSINN